MACAKTQQREGNKKTATSGANSGKPTDTKTGCSSSSNNSNSGGNNGKTKNGTDRHSKPRYGHNGAFVCEHIGAAAEGFEVVELSNFWSTCLAESRQWGRTVDTSGPQAFEPKEALHAKTHDPVQPPENATLREMFPSIHKNTSGPRLRCLRCNSDIPSKGDQSLCCPKCPAGTVLAADLDLLQVYCAACGDIVYHVDFDAARCHALLSSGNRGRFRVLEPGLGLRGMCNLGNTCYMNSVLQVLAQQPNVRDYFLSGEHNSICSVARAIRNSPECQTLDRTLHAVLSRARDELEAKAKAAREEKIDTKNEPTTSKTGKRNAPQSRKAPSRSKRRKKPVNVLRTWAQERDGVFLARYGITWLRPWSSYAEITQKRNESSDAVDSSSTSGGLDLPSFAAAPSTTNGGDAGPAAATGLPASLDPKIALGCIGCELEAMIKDMYCGTLMTQPILLNHFLYSTWQHAPWLSGYMQQDAHEFFSFVVNSAHSASGKPDNDVVRIRRDGTRELCDCVMHGTFGGILCSQIQCSACGEVSKSFEPFLDISLDCPTEQDAESASGAGTKESGSKDQAQAGRAEDDKDKDVDESTESPPSSPVKSSNEDNVAPSSTSSEVKDSTKTMAGNGSGTQCNGGANGSTKKASAPIVAAPTASTSNANPSPSARGGVLMRGLSFFAPPITLESMIEKFLAPEMLMAAIECGKCKTRKDKCSKRLRLTSLPPVLCFHIKRFKTNAQTGMAQKSDQSIVFPDTGLDLSKLIEDGDRNPQLFDLCGVVQHTGNIDSGHYFCFILHHGCWYKCDDVFVYRVSRQDVLASQAYMLFYTRRSNPPSTSS
ncbi:Ubiquitin carboxyl-terminal hydrolase family protein [Hondaea fermentalgiana]|uniref:Ubiquitin carboxyl-terminal hydrolase n=1 Tax=Hondaea fermentalgiana TaxID=2315210 RepID=A0A2R5GZX8_9STRA|nr:Ubiquitin carboxyl-terminal hydrolase family protein [Hondaea fermentalgiana]|eukprot:GBG33614.1 Ubiquitin carboxyl-terminal hydrolase family protein [Hondaea fermentalgiana]